MCRSTIDGGRRCPSHTDPLLIANRNARRRAKYAESHKKSGTPHAPERVKHAVRTFTSGQSLFKEYSAAKNIQPKALYNKKEEGEASAIGVTQEAYEGYLVEKGYISPIQNSGQINYTKLDEESYKEFGFQGPDEDRKWDLSVKELKELSKAELEDLPIRNKKAVKIFTGEDYEWINQALYGNTNQYNNQLPLDKRVASGEYTTVFDDTRHNQFTELPSSYMMLKTENASPELLTDITTHVDEAMTQTPGQQRIVYRGMSADHQAFSDFANVHDFAEANYPIGQELKFDGYQSTSYSPAVALEYARYSNGLIFEIKAASGLSVANISEYSEEQELILPRDSRYMVVGKHTIPKYKGWSALTGDDFALESVNTTVIQLVEITEDGYVRNESNLSSPPPLTEKQLRTNEKKHVY
jgi:hypothetical protein